ncbi:ATP-dependent DNA helicase RecQ-like [Dysidea avara]|uniref:ATP-dependent DNA helicase RecQ-like n=1 Tax=Dysidea avara TaxID=196820 RepID=UPI00331994AA
MALTATAIKTTLSSVKSRLAMEDPVIVGLPPDRSNIKMIVEPCPDLSELCEELAKDLRHKDYGKMCKMKKLLASDNDMREEIITEFCKNETKLRLIIASTAFGLGIDCKDIVRVINYGTPNTLEELVQEMGRAGKNGNQAQAILYHKAIGDDVNCGVW